MSSVWLDTEAEADTLLLGIGATRDEALACAEADLQAAIAEAWEEALGKLRAMRRETRRGADETGLEAVVSPLSKKGVTKSDLEWAVKLAARYLWCDRGDEGTQRLIEVLRDAGEKRRETRSTYVSGLVLAGELEAMIEEQQGYRRRVEQEAGPGDA
jgi:thioredoxin-like negative regulator of GroEL